MTDINKLNININNQLKIDSKIKEHKKETEEALGDELEQSNQPRVSYKDPDKVFEFMEGNINCSVETTTKKKIVEISKYVSQSDAKRINNSVKQYLKAIDLFEQKAAEEFNLPPEIARELALKAFEQNYLS